MRLVEIIELAKSRTIYKGDHRLWDIMAAVKQGDIELAWKLVLGHITTLHYAGIVTPEECFKHTNEGIVMHLHAGVMFSTLWRDGMVAEETAYYGNGNMEAHAVMKGGGVVSVSKWNREGVFLGTFLEKRENTSLLIF